MKEPPRGGKLETFSSWIEQQVFWKNEKFHGDRTTKLSSDKNSDEEGWSEKSLFEIKREVWEFYLLKTLFIKLSSVIKQRRGEITKINTPRILILLLR